MLPEVKFCGLTRPEDAREAARLGVGFAGVIFAGGPRHLHAGRARLVLASAGVGVRRVGVFARQPVREIAATVRAVGLDVVQLHGDPTAEDVDAVRGESGAQVWAVVRVADATLPPTTASLMRAADAVVLDAFAAGQLGGTGRAFGWHDVAPQVSAARQSAQLVVAGGLTPHSVGEAMDELRPDVVDVSSGVEVEPGVKDHRRMRAFVDAVRRAAFAP